MLTSRVYFRNYFVLWERVVYAFGVRLMGIDFGTKHVGIALSDREGMMAFPHAVFPSDTGLVATVVALAKNEEIGAIVIGHSRNYAGEANPVMAHTHVFVEKLKKAYDIPVHFESEILTTKEAERIQGKSTQTDASAAALILESYLARHRTQ